MAWWHGLNAVYMRLQRSRSHGPESFRHIVVGMRHPIFKRAVWQSPHGCDHFGFALQAVRFELGNRLFSKAEHMTVRWQDELEMMGAALGGQQIK
jgi:hypothetical protein